MRTVVLGKHQKINHPMGKGRWLTLQTQYVCSLMCDPFILARSGPPELWCDDEPLDAIDWSGSVNLLCPHPTLPNHVPLIDRVVRNGGCAWINSPSHEVAGCLQSLQPFGDVRKRFRSLRERWSLGPHPHSTYYFDDAQDVICLPEEAGHVILRIGDWPGIVVKGRVAVFAADFWVAMLRYINVPRFDTLLLDLANVCAETLGVMVGRPMTSDDWKYAGQYRELRRDFHAFGFAALTVAELNRCYGGKTCDLSEAWLAASRAATALAERKECEASVLLKSAFQLLAEKNANSQRSPAVFTDTLHGGGLFSDIGYCEFDWPQHAADVLEKHLDWAEHRGYRFNLDFAAASVNEMAKRFPKLFQRLRRAQENGLIEWVNGTYNQPYTAFHSLESQFRQFELGQDVFERHLGRKPTVFASQEFGFAPQLASILAMRGYKHAVLRVQHLGDVPTLSDERIAWRAPNGDQIDALPSHPYKSEQLNEVTYNNVHLKIFASQESGQVRGIFSGLGDITYYRPFREELARTAFYAEVFGSFKTWSQYFSSSETTPAEKQSRTFSMEELDCRASFIDPTWAAENRKGAGDYNVHTMRSMQSASLFAAAEMLDSLTSPLIGAQCESTLRKRAWKALNDYEGHDVHIAAKYPAGAFMSGVSSLSTGRSSPTIADYSGPSDTLPIGLRAERSLARSRKEARRFIRRRLLRLIGRDGRPDEGTSRFAVFNPSHERDALLRLKDTAGLAVMQGSNRIPFQAIGRDQYALARLPAHGIAVLDAVNMDKTSAAAADPADRVTAGADFMENQNVRVEFNRADGSIRMIRKSDGQTILDPGSHRFVLADEAPRCVQWRWLSCGPLKATLEVIIQLGSDRNRCRIRSRIGLSCDQARVEFHTRILRHPPISGDAWIHHLGVRFVLPNKNVSIHRCHLNVMESSQNDRIFSPLLLLARAEGMDVAFLNRGNQFYSRDRNVISNILMGANEGARAFSYAVAIDEPFPLAAAMIWSSPCVLRRLSLQAFTGETKSLMHSRSLINVTPKSVIISSVVRRDDKWVVRLASTIGAEVKAILSVSGNVLSATKCVCPPDVSPELDVKDGRVIVSLRPWDILEIAVGVEEASLHAMQAGRVAAI